MNIKQWDTSGQETYKSLVSSYYRGSHGCFLVYDVSSQESFLEIKNWYDEVSTESSETLKMLIGNKIDLKEQRIVSTETGTDFAKENQMKFIETSAKENTNVDLMFEMLTDLIFKHSPFTIPQEESSIHITKPQQEDSNSTCC